MSANRVRCHKNLWWSMFLSKNRKAKGSACFSRESAAADSSVAPSSPPRRPPAHASAPPGTASAQCTPWDLQETVNHKKRTGVWRVVNTEFPVVTIIPL